MSATEGVLYMRAKKIVGALALVAGIGIGTGMTTVNQPTAHAAYYSWTKTKTYATPVAFHQKNRGATAYMWDGHHTRKVHNLKNYPRTTWYLSKSVKMRGSIYYRVASGNGKTTGFIWRGYLTKGVNPYAGSTVTTGTSTMTSGATGNSTTNTNGLSIKTAALDEVRTNAVAKEQQAQDQQILALFPDAIPNDTLTLVANKLATIDVEEPDDGRQESDDAYQPLSANQIANRKLILASGSIEYENELLAGKITFSEYVKKDLARSGIDPDDYKGWSIGAGSFAKSDTGQFTGYGQFAILLIPAGVN